MELKNSHRLNKIRIWPFAWKKENVMEALLEKSQLYKARALLLGLVFIKTTNSELFTALSICKLSIFVWGNHSPCTMHSEINALLRTSTLKNRTTVSYHV